MSEWNEVERKEGRREQIKKRERGVKKDKKDERKRERRMNPKIGYEVK